MVCVCVCVCVCGGGGGGGGGKTLKIEMIETTPLENVNTKYF